jgi:hypothetical protein
MRSFAGGIAPPLAIASWSSSSARFCAAVNADNALLPRAAAAGSTMQFVTGSPSASRPSLTGANRNAIRWPATPSRCLATVAIEIPLSASRETVISVSMA